MKFRVLPILILFLTIAIFAKISNVFMNTNFGKFDWIADAAFAKEEGAAENSPKPPSPDAKQSSTDPSRYSSSKDKPKCNIDLIKDEQFSPADVEMLKKLSERRKELDNLRDNFNDKQNLLKLSEAKLDNKMLEMKKIRDEILDLVNQYKKQEDQKIDSLVKIYSNMKPKDASRIFEELDMETLLQVLNRMKEAKTAPILAQMNPTKAKDITIEMAGQKKLKTGCSCENIQ